MRPGMVVIEANSACAVNDYTIPGYPVLVPKRGGGHWTFCTHDGDLFQDFLAHGFCNMERHSPRDLFVSRVVYDCPNHEVDDLSFTVANVGESLLQFALPAVVVSGFLLGFLFALRHVRLDASRRIPLYPTDAMRRAVLILGAGAATALMMVPWLVWMALVLAYGLVSFLVWPFYGADMFETVPKHPIYFWMPFIPLAQRVRQLMGGVGDVQLLRQSQLPVYTTDVRQLYRLQVLAEVQQPRPAYLSARQKRRQRNYTRLERRR